MYLRQWSSKGRHNIIFLSSIGGSPFNSRLHLTPSNHSSPKISTDHVTKRRTSERLPLLQSRTGVAKIRTLMANYGFPLTLTAPWDIYINWTICSRRSFRCSTIELLCRRCQSRDIIVIKSDILNSYSCEGKNWLSDKFTASRSNILMGNY